MKRLLKSTAFVLVFALCMQLLPAFSAEEKPEAETAEQAQSSYILSEIIDERGEYTKRFRMSDGTIQAAQYAQPVHFERDGKWIDYNFQANNPNGFTGIANTLGAVLQTAGMMTPYHWWVRYEYAYQW